MGTTTTRRSARWVGIVAALAVMWSVFPSVANAAPTVSLLSAPSAPIVGQPTTARGSVSVPGVHDASIEVLLGGRWSTSQKTKTTNSGAFSVPITYGRTTAGTYRYRLQVDVSGTRVYSREFTITRLDTSLRVIRATPRAAVGGAASVTAHVRNLGAGRPVFTQFLVKGQWVTSRRGVTDTAGNVTIPLTYGAATAGTYTWRLTTVNPYGVRSTIAAHRLTRTGSVAAVIPDSRYSITTGPNLTNRVVLTYDDCPTSLTAFKQTVLAAEAADIGLALFPTGNCMTSGRFDAAFARAHGMHVFNHSVNHPDLTTLSSAGVRRELSAPGITTTYGRPPYGAYNATTKAAYRSVGMRIWTWTVDTNDWRGKSQSQVVNYVVSSSRGGDAVLMHMQWKGFSPTAVRAMKSGLNAKGVSVCRNYVGTVPVKPVSMWC